MTMLQTQTKNKKPDTVICDKQKAVSGSIYVFVYSGRKDYSGDRFKFCVNVKN